ncbi:MAG: glycoside hydrolase family 43 protein [Candidatus Omnitrophota bacterium]
MFGAISSLCLFCAIAAGSVADDSVFLMSYFRTADESLYMAYSFDGCDWTAFNDEKPLLRAEIGNKSVRDPFIRRGLDGAFYFVCTNSWKSSMILAARSKDLIHWEEQRLLPVMEGVKTVHNCWAPEFFYDDKEGSFLIYWSSVTEENNHQRIWSCRTKDFKTISPPRMLFDPGYTVIDATIEFFNGAYYMIYKDERGENKHGTDNKAMRLAVSGNLDGPYQPQGGLITPHLTEGPALFRAGGKWLLFYDCFMDDRWGAEESDDLQNWTNADAKVKFPPQPRHGSVFTVTRKQFEALRDWYNLKN